MAYPHLKETETQCISQIVAREALRQHKRVFRRSQPTTNQELLCKSVAIDTGSLLHIMFRMIHWSFLNSVTRKLLGGHGANRTPLMSTPQPMSLTLRSQIFLRYWAAGHHRADSSRCHVQCLHRAVDQQHKKLQVHYMVVSRSELHLAVRMGAAEGHRTTDS